MAEMGEALQTETRRQGRAEVPRTKRPPPPSRGTRACSRRSTPTSERVFSCAAAAVLAYEEYKRAWGLVDFVDQERLALELLGKPELEQQLRERLQTVFVDEFQDTSPLQLAVFVAMSRLAGSSVWVGDPKQSIYRFRQTDPDLITYVAQDIRNGDRRSRPDRSTGTGAAVAASSTSSTTPSARPSSPMGCRSEATRIAHVERKDFPGQQTPLNVWRAVKDFRLLLRRLPRRRASSTPSRMPATGRWPTARSCDR